MAKQETLTRTRSLSFVSNLGLNCTSSFVYHMHVYLKLNEDTVGRGSR